MGNGAIYTDGACSGNPGPSPSTPAAHVREDEKTIKKVAGRGTRSQHGQSDNLY